MGTILVDHERGQIVDLLPDRTPERVSQWLREHPGVEIVTRDRAEAYAQAITEGAPDALQVADRWHLLKNVTDALTGVLQDHRAAIVQCLDRVGAGDAEVPTVTTPPPSSASSNQAPGRDLMCDPPPTSADKRRQERAEQAHELHDQGWSQKAIAQHLNCHPKTIHRYLQRALPLPPRRGDRTTILDPHKRYILERWNAGCHNASQLLREIVPRGYNIVDPGICTVSRDRVR